jgi:imidazolonepropionase
MAEGVTTVEIKSGYGLDLESELKMLRAARRLGGEEAVRVSTSFLGAHAIPPEFFGKSDDYVDLLVDTVLPRVASEHLADAVDAFCETIAFSPAQVRRLFLAAKAFGLPVRLHADQRTDQGGGLLAAEFGALSAEHLEFASPESIDAMAKAGVVATLLPGAFYALKETRKPPIDAIRHAGVRMAVASDCNPGSAPIASLLTTINMACVLYELTPDEALIGATRHAAQALGLERVIGSIEQGKASDLVHWPISRPGELCYWIGAVKPHWIMRRGGRAAQFTTKTPTTRSSTRELSRKPEALRCGVARSSILQRLRSLRAANRSRLARATSRCDFFLLSVSVW